jgi:hypothetical protein
LSELNSHIRIYAPLALISGNPVPYLHHLREAGNKLARPAPDKIQRRREKFDFAEFVTKAGARAPKTYVLIASGSIQHDASASGEAVESFLKKVPEGSYFCKPNKGRNGIGAFRLTLSRDAPMMDDEPSSFAAIAERLSSEDYLIQEWMAPLQHPDIACFRDGVINTMRLITFKTEKGAKAVAASLRMAISLKSIDSWTQGGVVAAIDLEKGVLKPFGVLKKGFTVVEAHPGSGLAFRDRPIPHFHEAVRLACSMHHKLAGPMSLGWDIGLLADGPCFLESNLPWDILMSAEFNPNLVPDLLALHLPPGCEVAVRVDLSGLFINRIPTCWALSKALGVAMASGRIEHLSRERIILIVGGTQQAVQTAVQIFKRKGADFGASGVTVSDSRNKPVPGFDASAGFADR